MGLTLEYLVIMAWEGGDDGGVSGNGGLERGGNARGLKGVLIEF